MCMYLLVEKKNRLESTIIIIKQRIATTMKIEYTHVIKEDYRK